jgi:outer membrane autotransporter protein
MTKQKFYLLPLTALAATLAVAQPAKSDTTKGLYKSGFYTGLAAGYSHMNSSVQETLFIPGFLNTNASGTARKHGISGDVFAGYRFLFSNGFLTGLEVAFALDSNKFNKKLSMQGGWISNTTLKSQFKVVPAVVLGKQFSERWLGFVKLGASIARFKGNHAITVPPAADTTTSFKATKVGFMGGVGAEYAFNKQFSAIATLSYERFGRIKKTFADVSPVIGDKNEGTLKPSYITAKIGIAYKF